MGCVPTIHCIHRQPKKNKQDGPEMLAIPVAPQPPKAVTGTACLQVAASQRTPRLELRVSAPSLLSASTQPRLGERAGGQIVTQCQGGGQTRRRAVQTSLVTFRQPVRADAPSACSAAPPQRTVARGATLTSAAVVYPRLIDAVKPARTACYRQVLCGFV